MLIRWHGHSCFEIVTGMRIVVDPHNGRAIGIKPPKLRADVVLVTHDHFDHNAVHMVSGKPDLIKNPGRYQFDGVTILGIGAYHDAVQGAKRGKITMFKILAEGISVLHAGDLGTVPDNELLEKIGSVDVLMLPVGGKYTIDAKEAYETAQTVGAKVVIPMHYRLPGLSLAIGPVDDFLALYPEDRVLHVGNEIEISRAELPKEQEVWVFTY
ncbi:MAG: MBL fold metallo-hydrolase [Euryarchaeota archaeon]|nr:MBL fold metallo-hydrolase [Euryarchaeota archaeon]